MKNLQLVDSLDGGYMLFARKDYQIDDGIYSELYCALFSTKSSNWWGDNAFNINSYPIASKTENAFKSHNSNADSDINLIKKAISDDLNKFKSKNPDVEIEKISILAYVNKALEIKIYLTGNNESFNFIYTKTKESLEQIPFTTYDI
jgi:hypothetical protein